MSMKSAATPKEKLFRTASRLFFRHGYRAVGVDTIAAESGIGKMTLYRHYPSKDDLMSAYLEDSNRTFWAHFEISIRDARSPRERLLAFFQSLQDYVSSRTCYGCPFLNVATEYPEADYPGHQVALDHKKSVRLRFRQLAQAAGARNPEALADQLFLLMDGAYMARRMFGTKNPAAHLSEAARTLIEAALA
jgi:AcrR family transcriptional regulator